jgi:hypothetical protein
MPYFHVSSVRNRKSIQKHGLDSSRMEAAPGIAGSKRPEVEGVFLSRDCSEAAFFVKINDFGPVDLWAVDPAVGDQWVEMDTGFSYVVGTVPKYRLRLLRRDIAPGERLKS